MTSQAQLDFLKRLGDFSHGAPSTSTIARGGINATRLQKCFIEWMKDLLSKGKVIAIDGKTGRKSYYDSRDIGVGAIYMVNALASLQSTLN
ncbi:hypothetical protein AB6D73_17125 [Vibrio splendidus]